VVFALRRKFSIDVIEATLSAYDLTDDDLVDGFSDKRKRAHADEAADDDSLDSDCEPTKRMRKASAKASGGAATDTPSLD
jgi:hypothetical protein